MHRDAGFAIPPAASEPAPDLDAIAKMVDVQASPAEPEPSAQERQAERERLAAQREQERAARRAAEEQALQAAAEQDARRAADQQAQLLTQQAARYDDELASRQRQADEEKRRADEALARSREEEQRQAALAAQQLAEQRRVQAEQERTQQLVEQQRVQAEQARAQQLVEQQRIQAERERAQQLAEQQRMQVEQARAQQLAEQQRIQAEQQRARQQAEQLAREKAEQAGRAERLARQEPAPVRDSGIDGPGRGSGSLPRTALDGPLVSRARELLRGIELDKPVPQAVRPAEDARRNVRRALADTAQHDVPLRLYIDSIRQKIERNAIVSPSQLAGDAVRIFPIVSITVRSDGSIEDVTILRSSGHADIDEVVRRIAHLNARYAAFPPNVAAHYDVVELRRVWSFAGVLRLLEEMR
jgi:TonB family protein